MATSMFIFLFDVKMKEREIKILEVNSQQLIKQLEWLWAVKLFEGEIYDTYFDFPTASLASEHKKIRIRYKSDHSMELTFKQKNKKAKKKKNYKQRKELQLGIDDGQEMSAILQGLGMQYRRSKHKHRVSYMLDGVVFDFDTYEYIPTLLEIEAKNNKEIKHWIQVLWLQDHKIKMFWAKALFKYYSVQISEDALYQPMFLKLNLDLKSKDE